MQIIERFFLAPDKPSRLFWTAGYVKLSQEVFEGYQKTGEASEAKRHIANCASRWGISRTAAEAVLKREAAHELDDEAVTITRNVSEE